VRQGGPRSEGAEQSSTLAPEYPESPILDVGAEGLDVHSTLLAAMGTSDRLEPSGRSVNWGNALHV